MDTPNECAGHNYDCDVLELIVLDLRASQAKKIVAQLRSCSRTLHDLKHWTPSQVSAFLKEVFPEAAEAKVANMMKRLQPVLRRGSAPAPAPQLRRLTLDYESSCLAGTDAEAPSKLPPMSMSWSPTASSTPSSPLTPLTPLAAPAGFDRRESKAAKHRAAITHADMVCAAPLVHAFSERPRCVHLLCGCGSRRARRHQACFRGWGCQRPSAYCGHYGGAPCAVRVLCARFREKSGVFHHR